MSHERHKTDSEVQEAASKRTYPVKPATPRDPIELLRDLATSRATPALLSKLQLAEARRKQNTKES